MPVIHAMQDTASSILWGSAYKHSKGGGLEKGFDFSSSFAWVSSRRSSKEGEEEEHKAMK